MTIKLLMGLVLEIIFISRIWQKLILQVLNIWSKKKKKTWLKSQISAFLRFSISGRELENLCKRWSPWPKISQEKRSTLRLEKGEMEILQSLWQIQPKQSKFSLEKQNTASYKQSKMHGIFISKKDNRQKCEDSNLVFFEKILHWVGKSLDSKWKISRVDKETRLDRISQQPDLAVKVLNPPLLWERYERKKNNNPDFWLQSFLRWWERFFLSKNNKRKLDLFQPFIFFDRR